MKTRRKKVPQSKHIVDISIILLIVAFFCCACAEKKGHVEQKKASVENINLDTSKIERFAFNCSIRAIAPKDEKTCWYAGSRGQFGFTEDRGRTWQIDSIQHPDQLNLEFRSIAHTKANTFLLSIASPALLFKTSDKGKTWNVVYRENDSLAFYDAMAFWDDQEGIAMGDPTDECLSIIKTKDGGESWQKISCAKLPAAEKGEAAFAASNTNIDVIGNNVWIATGGQRARVFRSTDRGETWEVFSTPIVQGGAMTGIYSCDFYDENTGIIMGGNWEDKELNKGNKAITKDGGETWNVIAEGDDPSYRSCVQFIGHGSSKEVIAVGIPGISFSKDEGNNWEKLSEESFYTVKKAGNVLWFGGSNKMARLSL